MLTLRNTTCQGKKTLISHRNKTKTKHGLSLMAGNKLCSGASKVQAQRWGEVPRVTAQMQADGVPQRVSAEKSPRSLFPLAFHPSFQKNCSCLLQSPNKKQMDEKTCHVGVRSSAKSCRLTAKFMRHYLPKEKTHQRLAPPTMVWFTAGFSSWLSSSYVYCSLQWMPLRGNTSEKAGQQAITWLGLANQLSSPRTLTSEQHIERGDAWPLPTSSCGWPSFYFWAQQELLRCLFIYKPCLPTFCP